MRAPAWLLLLRNSCRRGYRRQLLDTLEAVGVEQDRMAHLDDIEPAFSWPPRPVRPRSTCWS